MQLAAGLSANSSATNLTSAAQQLANITSGAANLSAPQLQRVAGVLQLFAGLASNATPAAAFDSLFRTADQVAAVDATIATAAEASGLAFSSIRHSLEVLTSERVLLVNSTSLQVSC